MRDNIDNSDFRRRTSVNPFTEPGAGKQYPPDLELEPQHLDVTLDLDLAAASATGRVTTTVRARRSGVDTLSLDAVDLSDLTLHDVDENDITWRYDATRLIVTWKRPFRQDEERSLAISYRVNQPVAGLYFSKPDEAYPDAPWYAATDHETERARYWLPCIDLPNVRTTIDMRLHTDARFTMLANGQLIDETLHSDGSKTAHWRLEQRSPSYLICFAVGDFTKADDGEFVDTLHNSPPIPVAYYCSRQHSSDHLFNSFGRTKAMLAWMTQKLDMAFPYPKYYQFALPGITGAMENISLVSWDEKYVLDQTLAQELTWLVDSVNVHEMAHSYFGDAIVCRDFAHAWLKESWATYIEQLWREDNDTRPAADYIYYCNATSYFDEADHWYSRPIVTRQFRSSWDMYDTHLYEGGACRLHTLRNELGDEIFWCAVRNYVKRYNGKVVETDDFRLVLEQHSGRSLGRFFDQWFHSAGYPNLKVTFQYDDKRKQGTFEIEQTQSGENATIFVLNSELAWLIAGEETRWPIKLDQAKQTFIVPMATEPEMVRFDPDQKVLHKLSFNPGDGMLRRQLVESKEIIGRIQAAQELAQTGKRTNLQAILDAYPNEPYWGVRREFALALGDAGHEVAVAGIAQMIQAEQDPMVLSALFRAAGNYRDVRLAEAIAERLTSGLPELAHASACDALGKQRQLAPLSLLLEATARSGVNGYAQQGAMRGLAATRRNEAVEALLERVRYGATTPYARPTAADALAGIGLSQEKPMRDRIVEALVDLLRDPQTRMARAAATALGRLRAIEAIPAIAAFARSLDVRQRVEVERVITELRAHDKADGSAFKKQVEDLTDKLRKLEDQVQKLTAQFEARPV